MVTAGRERRPAAATSDSGGGRTLVTACAGRATLRPAVRTGRSGASNANGTDGCLAARVAVARRRGEQRLNDRCTRWDRTPGLNASRPAVTCHDGRTRTRLESTTFTPFSRLALAHAVSVAGDVFVTISLADSIFFGATTSAARGQGRALPPADDGAVRGRRAGARPVARPDAGRSAAPDRGVLRGPGGPLPPDGRRDRRARPLSARVRDARAVEGPLVAKSALVPAVVDSHDELVLANSRLALIAVGGRRRRGTDRGGDPQADERGVGAAARHGDLRGSGSSPRSPSPREERRPAGDGVTTGSCCTRRASSIAGSAMGLMRGVVGFITFFAAFVLKKQGEPAWVFGLVIIASAVGNALGTRDRAAAPQEGARGVDPRGFARRAGGPAAVRGPFVRPRSRSSSPPVRSPPARRWLASRSTACCSATAPRPRGAARSHASRRDSRSSGCSAACSRCCSSVAAAAGIFLVALVLLFGGLSYVGAVRRRRCRPEHAGAGRSSEETSAPAWTKRLNRRPCRSRSAQSDPTRSTT